MKSPIAYPILILAAMNEEILPLVEKFAGEPFRLTGLKGFFHAKFQGHDLYFLVTGVGKKQVRYRLKKVLLAINPRSILSIGTAGGIDPEFQIGDNIMSENVLSQNHKGDLILELPQGESRFFQKKLALISEIDVKTAKYSLTINSVYGKEEKGNVAGKGIALIDMEAWHSAKVAHELLPHCPFISIRAISDSVTSELPSPEILSGKKEAKNNPLLKTHVENMQYAIKSNINLVCKLLKG